MKTSHYFKFAPFAALCASAAVLATPPATSPYATDPVNEYVQDDTAQGISSMNMVLCVIGSMDPGDMVNAGPYLALVDMNKCQNKGGGGAGAAGATNYANAVVNVTRATNSDPMVARVWLSLTEQGNATNVYAYLTATQSPAAAPPYGVFRMDYIGKKNGQVGFNGYIDAQPGTITFLETGANSSNTALAMTANSTTSGAGTMHIAGNGGGASTFNFAYSPAYFRRADASSDQCFDRSKANASISVWQYGTYNAIDGTRVDLANPGFPILATYGGVSYYGFANYYGVNFQGLDLNSLADASPVPGLAVSDQRPGNTAAYRLSKVGGKLTKWTQVQATLGALDGIPFTFGADLGAATNGLVASGWSNWVVQWSTANQTFSVVGQQVCGSNGCQTSTLATPVPISNAYLNTVPIVGWADSFGGNLTIPFTGATHAASDPIYYYLQATVIPGAAGAPTALYCLSQCPTTPQLAGYAAGSLTTPFANGTDSQWFSAPSSANTVTYTFGATGLADSGPIIADQASQYPSGSQYAQNGLQTGRLFDAPLAFCSGSSGPLCEPASPATYYTWQTGTNQWSQSLWLTRNSDGSVVAFDPPENIAYTVPGGAGYGTWANKSILLQFNGFGNLYGVPGSCVSSVDNSAVDCSTPNARYVASFAIPDGAMMTLPSPSTPLIVKALNAEIRLLYLGAGAAQCNALTLAPLALPSGGTHDPSNATDSEYLGTMPTVTAAPKVIDGVVQ